MKFSAASCFLYLATLGAVQAHSGKMTYYYPGLGACGWTNTNSDHVVALSEADYAAADCGKHIKITCKNGNTVKAKVVDKCPGCEEGHIDVSPSVFKHCAKLAAGTTEVKWHYV